MLLATNVTEKLKLHSTDAKKAFLMRKAVLRRPVYLHVPKEIGVEIGEVVRVICPVYVVPESSCIIIKHTWTTSDIYLA